MRCRWLFFYGTLTEDHDNRITRAVLPLLSGGCHGHVRGRLLALRSVKGWYPALTAGHGRVIGRLYRAGSRFSLHHLRLLDRYEDCDLRCAARSEYRRRLVRVGIRGNGCVQAMAYVYNRPVHAGLVIIARGDFSAFLRRRRVAAYGAL